MHAVSYTESQETLKHVGVVSAWGRGGSESGVTVLRYVWRTRGSFYVCPISPSWGPQFGRTRHTSGQERCVCVVGVGGSRCVTSNAFSRALAASPSRA
ncbi:hypothetical protein C0Q70_03035 [Pomacea canaliculata]|uniref:Uncharacterized protein n=1 Tax=Pomacea canaliculata TaxID=400727 RepID=A0A2T7PRM1_POMCA|nr:hypothetical protein C0Q70_03035 [Pomacea canaliculata]